jgi:hypothetical protein
LLSLEKMVRIETHQTIVERGYLSLIPLPLPSPLPSLTLLFVLKNYFRRETQNTTTGEDVYLFKSDVYLKTIPRKLAHNEFIEMNPRHLIVVIWQEIDTWK